MDISVASFATYHIESKINEGSSGLAIVKSDATALFLMLKSVNKMLAGAKGRTELSTSNEVKPLVEELRKIACEAEDEVDTLVSETSFLAANYFRARVSKKLRVLKERARVVKGKLYEQAEGSRKDLKAGARTFQALKGHLPADDDLVIGIQHEIERIVDQLTRKFDDGQPPMDKLAIVGMGGSGKTTLARSVYNHCAIEKHYNFHAWVSVSQAWDTSNVLLDILTQIGGQESPLNNDDLMITELNKLVDGKTCLIVFDDVWDWESLYMFIRLIQGDDTDSQTYTIIITSRQTPSNEISRWRIHQPESLTDDNCWYLFSKVASSPKPLGDEYRTLAMDMMRNCQGLPLAIVALGRLLKTKDTMNGWQKVSNQIEGGESTSLYGPVNKILGLSYEQLPFYLKPCFLYLGLFPEGRAISGGTLIRMWIAEGFIENEHLKPLKDGKETLEVAGRRYLQELIDHTMVQVVRKTYSGKAKFIRIHDIMRDFCILRARDLDFLAVSSFGPEAIGKTSRRVAINLSKDRILPEKSPHLRSLAIFGQSSTSGIPDRYSNQVSHTYLNLDQVWQMYKLLRVLDIVGIKSLDGTLPKEIGSLIHLTYLRIRSTNIRKLPKSIGNLRNLLVLDYWEVFNDTEVIVPNVLWKLKKLRHLYLPNEMSGSMETLQLDTLKDLITLWGVSGGAWMLKEMSKLSPTMCKLYIHRMSTKGQFEALLSSPVIKENEGAVDKTNQGCLYALTLDWYGFEITNLSALCFKQSLQKLRLIGKAPDTEYSRGCPFPTNLGKLELFYTQLRKQDTLSQLGKLAFLKVLKLCKDSYEGSEWRCNKREFPLLEELKLANLPNFEKWEIEQGALRCLKKLSIVSCLKLKRIPEGLKLLRNLENLDIEQMPSSFISRLRKGEEGEDFEIIKHILHVRSDSGFLCRSIKG